MLFVFMFDKRMLEAVDPELGAYLKEYLSALCRDSMNSGCTTETVLVNIGKWVIARLGYPSGLSVEIHTPPKQQQARFKRDYREAIFQRDDWRCTLCGSGEDLTVDHIKPISKGGSTELKNLQTLCRKCNSKKGTHHDPT